MNAETFCEHFAKFADAPNGITKLRTLLLELAFRGRLLPQDENDGPAINDLTEIDDEKQSLISARNLRPNRVSEIEQTRVMQYPVPPSWRWFRLSDVTFFQEGPGIRNWQFRSEGVKLLNVQNIVDNKLVLDNSDRYIATDEFECTYKHFAVEVGDILLASSGGSWGKTAWFEDPGYPVMLNTSMIRLKFFSKRFSDDFLLLFLRSKHFRMQMETQLVGMQPNFGSTHLGRVYIPIPPLAEQRRIVEKVDQLLGLCDELAARQAAQREKRQRLVGATLDRLVSTRAPAEFPNNAHRLRNHFDQLFDTPTTIPQLRQTILQLAVQGQLVPQDPNDEPARCLRQRLAVVAIELQASGRTSRRKPFPAINESDVPFFLPERWVWVRFGELAAEVEYGTSQKASEIGGDVPVLRMNAIRDGRVVLEESKFVASTIKDLPKLYLKNGDILFNRTNSYELVGKSGVFYGPDNKFTFASYLIRGSLLPELLPEFITIAMNAKYYRITQIEPEVTQQCGQANFNGTKLQHSLIPLPPLAEQKRIVTKVTELLSLCDALEAKLTQAESASTQLLSAAVHHLLNNSVETVR